MTEFIHGWPLTVPHGFFDRTDGVSTGDLASLNCGIGSNDEPELVAENRRRALEAVAPGRIMVAPYQTHSSICLTVTDPWPDAARPEADALVTRQRGIALSILTADCAPVLLEDADTGVIGAAHAGWRGAVGGVLEATVAAMRALGATRISAVVGPCIGPQSYEVSPGFGGGQIHERYFWKPRRTEQLFFNLKEYVFDRLVDCDLGGLVATLNQDTLSQPQRYFSYRRATLAGEPGYGRQISIIALD